MCRSSFVFRLGSLVFPSQSREVFKELQGRLSEKWKALLVTPSVSNKNQEHPTTEWFRIYVRILNSVTVHSWALKTWDVLPGTQFRPLGSFSWLLDSFTSHDHPKMFGIYLNGSGRKSRTWSSRTLLFVLTPKFSGDIFTIMAISCQQNDGGKHSFRKLLLS